MISGCIPDNNTEWIAREISGDSSIPKMMIPNEKFFRKYQRTFREVLEENLSGIAGKKSSGLKICRVIAWKKNPKEFTGGIPWETPEEIPGKITEGYFGDNPGRDFKKNSWIIFGVFPGVIPERIPREISKF